MGQESACSQECHLGFHFAFKSGKRQGRKIRQGRREEGGGRREEGGGVEVLGGGEGKRRTILHHLDL